MGFFDVLAGAAAKGMEGLEKINREAANMSESELLDLYDRGKRRSNPLQMSAAKVHLKRNYGYTDDDFIFR